MSSMENDPHVQGTRERAARYQARREAAVQAKMNTLRAEASGDAQTARNLASITARVDEINQRNAIQPPVLTDLEVFGLRSARLAEISPRWSAARVALAKGLAIIPLQARSSEPVNGVEPTRSEAEAFSWWSDRADLNVGVLAGERSGVLVLQLDGSDASRRWLRELIRADMRVVDDEDGSHEVGMPREWQPGRLYCVEPRKAAVFARAGWGRSFSRGLEDEFRSERERRRRTPSTYVFGWPVRANDEPAYPFPWRVDTSWSFRSRRVSEGVSLLASGEPVVWEGSVLPDGRTVHVNMTPLQNLDNAMPVWLADAVGGKRKR